MRLVLFVLAMACATPAAAQSIPGNPLVYYDFTGTARTATEKLDSLVNVGTAPTIALQGSMTTADITAAGAHLVKDDVDGDFVPDKWFQLVSSNIPTGEMGTMFIRFTPDSVTLAGAPARYPSLATAQGNWQFFYGFNPLTDIEISLYAQARGGGGSIPKTVGPEVSHATGATWDIFGAWDLWLTTTDKPGGDTGENCMKVRGSSIVCEATIVDIGIPLQAAPWTYYVGYLPDQVHGGENTGTDGNIEIFALFDTKLTESEMEAFLAYLDGETPAASPRRPRLLRRILRR